MCFLSICTRKFSLEYFLVGLMTQPPVFMLIIQNKGL